MKQRVIGAILGPKLGSIVDTELEIELGFLVSLGEEYEYRPGLELQRNFETGLREGLERGEIVSRRATRAIRTCSRQTRLQSFDRLKISLEKDDMSAISLERRTKPRPHEEEIVSKVATSATEL